MPHFKEKGGLNRGDTEDFYDSESFLCSTIGDNMSSRMSKPIGSRTPRVNLRMKYEFWVIIRVNVGSCILVNVPPEG